MEIRKKSDVDERQNYVSDPILSSEPFSLTTQRRITKSRWKAASLFIYDLRITIYDFFKCSIPL